jgi:hypothetical protein
MADDKTNRGERDRSRINMSEDGEVLDGAPGYDARGAAKGRGPGREFRERGGEGVRPGRLVWVTRSLANSISAASVAGRDPSPCVVKFSDERLIVLSQEAVGDHERSDSCSKVPVASGNSVVDRGLQVEGAGFTLWLGF